MGLIYNSVQQISDECDKLIELGKECEYLDIRSMIASLIPAVTELKEYFDVHPEDTRGIEERKNRVEEMAIRAEYFIAHRLKEFVERNSMRDEAKEIYAFCRQRLLTAMRSDASKDEVLFWSGIAKWAMQYYVRSLHVLFEKTQDDIDKLTTIREQAKQEGEIWKEF